MKILITLLEISVYSAVILAAILIIKKVLGKKMTAAVQFSLWMLLILRLLMPVSLDSGMHFYSLPSEPVQTETAIEYNQGTSAYENIYINNLEDTPATQPEYSDSSSGYTVQPPVNEETVQSEIQTQKYKLNIEDALLAAWLAGIIVLAVVMAQSYIRLKKRINKGTIDTVPESLNKLFESCKARLNVKSHLKTVVSSEFESTMLLAALKPILIVPKHLLAPGNEEILTHCIMHELAHYKRRDYLWYLLINVLCALYWFNPAVWIGTRLMKQDMEVASDAHAVRTMPGGERDRYAKTLLAMFSNRNKRFQVAMGMGIAAKKEVAKRLRGIYMKRKMKMKTSLSLIVVALMVLFTCFTTACQPGEPVTDSAANATSQNSQTQIIETQADDLTQSADTAAMVFETPTEPYEAPEYWKETIQDDTLTVDIDTDIAIPDTDKFPVAKAEVLTLTQDYVDELIDYFVPEGRFYEWPQPRTKEYYEELLEQTRKGMYIDGEYVVDEERIAELESKQAEAPIEAKKVYVDTTLTYPIIDPNEPRSTAGGKNFLSVAVESSGQTGPAYIAVGNFVEGINDRTIFSYREIGYMNEAIVNRLLEDEQEMLDQNESMAVFDEIQRNDLEIALKRKEALDSITLTREEVEPYAQKLMRDLGFTDLQLTTVQKAIMYPAFGGSANFFGTGGYEFVYSRKYNGLSGYTRSGWGGSSWEDPPAYVEPFEQETIKILVDKDGVKSFSWFNSIGKIEKMYDSVKLLPFEQIKEAAIRQIKNKIITPLSNGKDYRFSNYYSFDNHVSGYGGNAPDSYNYVAKVKVVSAELCMGYVSTDLPNQALMVPVWKFDVYDVSGTNSDELREANHEIIVINAIDGGAVDRYTPEQEF